MGRRFLVVWAGQMLSMIGSTLTGFALLVKVYFDTGEILWLAVLTLANVIPAMVAAPLMGVIDRYDRRKALIVSDSAAAVVTLALFGLLAQAQLSPALAVAVGVIYTFIGSFQQTAYAALVPALVEPGELDRANGLVQLAPSVSTVVAPGLAGLLIATTGFRTILAIDLATFAAALFALVATRVEARAARDAPTGADPAAEPGSFSLASAVRWLRANLPAIGHLLLLASLGNMFLGIFNVVVIAHATDLGGEAGSGIPSTVGGAAMVLVSLAVGAFGLPKRRMKTLGLAMISYGGLLIAASAGHSLAWFAVLAGAAMGTISVVQPALSTTFQEHVPGSMHGRLFGLRNAIGRGATPLGNLVAIPLAAWSVAGTVTVAGVGLAAIGLAVLSVRSLDAIDRPPGGQLTEPASVEPTAPAE